MKTKHNGLFIALKYGAAAMAGASGSYVYLKRKFDLKEKAWLNAHTGHSNELKNDRPLTEPGQMQYYGL